MALESKGFSNNSALVLREQEMCVFAGKNWKATKKSVRNLALESAQIQFIE
jgi:hypothetical protein